MLNSSFRLYPLTNRLERILRRRPTKIQGDNCYLGSTHFKNERDSGKWIDHADRQRIVPSAVTPHRNGFNRSNISLRSSNLQHRSHRCDSCYRYHPGKQEQKHSERRQIHHQTILPASHKFSTTFVCPPFSRLRKTCTLTFWMDVYSPTSSLRILVRDFSHLSLPARDERGESRREGQRRVFCKLDDAWYISKLSPNSVAVGVSPAGEPEGIGT